ncbi:hypothetical protein OAJ30_04440 [Alphaproteobacteria bacterium]|nr:hypothetical protein [Alphaproteobacteria bacterium]
MMLYTSSIYVPLNGLQTSVYSASLILINLSSSFQSDLGYVQYLPLKFPPEIDLGSLGF